MQVLKDYQPFIASAKKLGRQGRKGGGVMVVLRKDYAQFFKRIDARFENFVVLEMADGFMSHDKSVMCVFCYTPPRDSPAHAQTDSGKGIEITEHCLADLYEVTNDFYLFMCGDFNACTNQDNGTILSANARISGDDDPFLDISSQDLRLKGFRTHLLSLCGAMSFSILNGVKYFGFDTVETYTSPTGSSTIDYFV